MEKVDHWFNSMITKYKNGHQDAFYYYPMGSLKQKLTDRGLERSKDISVSQWLCQLLAVGELTEDELRLALYETLAERHMAKLESPYFLKKMFYNNDLHTSTINTSKEDLTEHPEHLIRYIRTLNTSERGYLRWAVKKRPEIIAELHQKVMNSGWSEPKVAEEEADD